MQDEDGPQTRRPLDARTVDAATARDKDYKLSDTGGLYLFVSRSGHRTWRLKYRFGGKERRLLLGAYPELGLKRAREMRDDAKFSLRDGRDPALERTRARHARKAGHENTFEQFAREWHAGQIARWKPIHAADVLESMEANLFGEIGGVPVDQIDEGLLLHALRKVEARGAVETAHRLRQRAERVFRFAAGAGVPNGNPAVNVRDALRPVPPKTRFLALTAQRPGMVREMLWTEIEGVDWADPHATALEGIWRVPAAKMKQELDLREDETFEHRVPLSRGAIDVLRTVRPFSGGRGIVFPGGRDSGKPLSENAVGYLYNREGWKGRHVPHGWRSSFSTIMNGRLERSHPGAERLLIDRLVIDLMLAHTPSGMSHTELVYNRNAYMERRRELAEDWATVLLEGADPVATLLDGRRRRVER